MLATERGLEVRGSKGSRSRRHRSGKDKTNLFGQSEFRPRAPRVPRAGFGFSGIFPNHRNLASSCRSPSLSFFPPRITRIAYDSQSFDPVFTVLCADSGLLRPGLGRGRKDRFQIRFQSRQGGGGLYPGAAGGGVYEGARLRFRFGHGAPPRSIGAEAMRCTAVLPPAISRSSFPSPCRTETTASR